MQGAMDHKTVSIAAALVLQGAALVWFISGLNSRVIHNNFQIKMMSRDIEKASEFIELWPAGKWGSGSLPDDVRQNLKIERLERDLERITRLIENH